MEDPKRRDRRCSVGGREVGATWRSRGPGEASGVPQGPHQPLGAVLCLLQELRASLLLKTPWPLGQEIPEPRASPLISSICCKFEISEGKNQVNNNKMM